MRRLYGAVLLICLTLTAGGCFGWRPKSAVSTVNSTIVRGMVDMSMAQSDLACTSLACNILSTYINNTYASSAGTSLAAPFVSAAAGVLKASGLSSPADIEAALVNYARPLGKDQNDLYYGGGLLDILAALDRTTYHLPLSVTESIEAVNASSIQKVMPAIVAPRVDIEEKHLVIGSAPHKESYLLNELARLGITAERKGDAWLVSGLGDPSKIATTLLQKGLAKSAEVATVWHAMGSISTDPLSYKQWGLSYSGFPSAWQRSLPLNTVTVAVLDTGLEMSHIDLPVASVVSACSLVTDDQPLPKMYIPGQEFNHSASNQYCWNSTPTDNNGHGTAVTGVIAAIRDNGIGVAGAGSGFKVMPVRVLNSEGSGDDITVAYGIYYAADNGADVINLSLGGRAGAAVHPEVMKAIDYARNQKGVVVVAAAGNHAASRLSPPASYEPVVSVGAISIWGARAAYSNYGQGLDLVAPGGAASSTLIPTIFAARTEPGVSPSSLDVATYASLGSNGSYGFALPAGVFRIYAWIDVNLDGIINSNDYLAESDPQLLRAGGELTGVYLKMEKYSGIDIEVH